jgi:hypothetical protein
MAAQPPQFSANQRTMLSPSPVPPRSRFVEKNGSKTRSSASGAIPSPVSRTRTTTYRPPRAKPRNAASCSETSTRATSMELSDDFGGVDRANVELLAPRERHELVDDSPPRLPASRAALSFSNARGRSRSPHR